jgi:hypothetical protein
MLEPEPKEPSPSPDVAAVLRELGARDVDRLTPLEALELVATWQRRLREPS